MTTWWWIFAMFSQGWLLGKQLLTLNHVDDQVIREIIATAIQNCNAPALHALSGQYRLTVEQVWSIENAIRVIELLCTFS